MPTRPEAFFKPPGVSELQPCARTDLKRPCDTLFRLVGHTTNTYFLPAKAGTRFGQLCWSVHGSGWVCPGSAGSRSKPSDTDIGKLACIFGAAGLVWATTLRLDPPKKAMCHTRPVGMTYGKYQLPPSSRTWQFRTDTSICWTNTLILYICSVYSIRLFHLFSLPCLLSGP